jgi:hypothetical protein
LAACEGRPQERGRLAAATGLRQKVG